jgi:N-acetylglucosaminyl-diphospho-decaprenol L-rhamnosyltransferase
MRSSIDVVIVAYNRYELTESCLRHLAAQTAEHQVIVLDNGSTDDTRVRLAQEWPHVRLRSFDENRGFPEACNRAVESGSGEIVVLLNNDVDCRPDFLERIVAPFDDPTIGSVGSLMVQPGEEMIDGMGFATDAVLAGFPRLQGLPVSRAYDTQPVFMGAGGSAGAYRRTAWEQLGGLDETIMAYMEDFDLALRLRIGGWRSVAEPDAVGVHLGSATNGYRSAWQRRKAGFGRGYMLRRYGLLHGRSAARVLATEATVVIGDLLVSRDLEALRGRLEGWHVGRSCTQLPLPPADCLDTSIGFLDSLAMRRAVYGRRAA